MYLPNKYTTWYHNIINCAKTRLLPNDHYVERHHIIPKSLGGDNSPTNIVILTAKEHFICHLLLTKMVESTLRAKMVYAFHGMSAKQPNQLRVKGFSGRVQSRLYNNLKQELSTIKSESLKGYHHSDASKEKMSLSQKGKVVTESTKEKIRVARANQDMSYRKGKPLTDEQKVKISNTLAGNIPWNKGKTQTGFGDPRHPNPMKNPDSIQKMLATRKLNQERRAAGNSLQP